VLFRPGRTTCSIPRKTSLPTYAPALHQVPNRPEDNAAIAPVPEGVQGGGPALLRRPTDPLARARMIT